MKQKFHILFDILFEMRAPEHDDLLRGRHISFQTEANRTTRRDPVGGDSKGNVEKQIQNQESKENEEHRIAEEIFRERIEAEDYLSANYLLCDTPVATSATKRCGKHLTNAHLERRKYQGRSARRRVIAGSNTELEGENSASLKWKPCHVRRFIYSKELHCNFVGNVTN